MKLLRTLASCLLIAVAFASPLFAAAPEGSYVQLFENKDLKGKAAMIKTDTPDLKAAASDDGKNGFDDRASSVKYDIPPNWEVVLYEDANYQKRVYVLKGTGEIKDLSTGEDKVSSVRWEQH
jgi:hypothetical protein